MEKVFLIDLDDTILDFQKTQSIALEGLYESCFKAEVEWANFKLKYTQINHGLWDRLAKAELNQRELRTLRFQMILEQFPVGGISALDLATEYECRMAEVAEFCKGGFELASAAAKVGTLVIATNGLANVQRKRIEKSGLENLAKLIWISDEVKLAKPDPLFFLQALDFLKVDKENSIAIGDSPSTDGMCAHLAGGIPFWWINWNSVSTKVDVDKEFATTQDAFSFLSENFPSNSGQNSQV